MSVTQTFEDQTKDTERCTIVEKSSASETAGIPNNCNNTISQQGPDLALSNSNTDDLIRKPNDSSLAASDNQPKSSYRMPSAQLNWHSTPFSVEQLSTPSKRLRFDPGLYNITTNCARFPATRLIAAPPNSSFFTFPIHGPTRNVVPPRPTICNPFVRPMHPTPQRYKCIPNIVRHDAPYHPTVESGKFQISMNSAFKLVSSEKIASNPSIGSTKPNELDGFNEGGTSIFRHVPRKRKAPNFSGDSASSNALELTNHSPIQSARPSSNPLESVLSRFSTATTLGSSSTVPQCTRLYSHSKENTSNRSTERFLCHAGPFNPTGCLPRAPVSSPRDQLRASLLRMSCSNFKNSKVPIYRSMLPHHLRPPYPRVPKETCQASNKFSAKHFYLIDPILSLTQPEDYLWKIKYFGSSTPQQLSFTLVYLMCKLFGLRSGLQLRSDLDGRFRFVLLNDSSELKITKLPNGAKLYTGSFTVINSNEFRLDWKVLLNSPTVRLLYIPEKSAVAESSNTVPISGNPTHMEAIPKVGYLLGHDFSNNHERCVTCMHGFYLSKRPSTRGPMDEPYFTVWFSHPFGQRWYRARPIGVPGLHQMLCSILTVLNWAATASKEQLVLRSRSRSSDNTFDVVMHLARSHLESTVTSKLRMSPSYDRSPESPLNLVVRDDRSKDTHPTCLDYWPELTERARQSEWQCAGCKTCSVCQDAQSSTNLLVCDACDKGFHPGCHDPKVEEPVDRSLPWVCTACRNEGYSVAIGTMPNETSDQFCPGTSVHSKESEHSDGEDTEVNVTEVDDELETAAVDSPKFKHSPAKYECNEHSPSIGTRAVVSLESSSSLAGSPNSFKTPKEQTLSTPKTEDNESGIKASISPKSAEQDIKTDRPESNRSVAPDPFDEDTNKVQECPTAIRTWSVEHVRDWLLREGFAREAEAFYQQEIDGACLLLMKRMDVLTELGIKLGPAVKIYERIRRLQSNCTSSSSPMSS